MDIAIAVTAAPSITINIWEGVKNVDTKLVAMARVFEATRPAIVRRVLMPQIFPYVMASARFGLGIIWKITVLVELIGRAKKRQISGAQLKQASIATKSDARE